MKIKMSNRDVLDALEFGFIVPVDDPEPPKGWRWFLLTLALGFFQAFRIALLSFPALIYCYILIYFWPILKAEGVTIWQAGTGLVALYGLALHWWRTSIQEKQYRMERMKMKMKK